MGIANAVVSAMRADTSSNRGCCECSGYDSAYLGKGAELTLSGGEHRDVTIQLTPDSVKPKGIVIPAEQALRGSNLYCFTQIRRYWLFFSARNSGCFLRNSMP